MSYEDVDSREGKEWWQCIFCVPDVRRLFLFSPMVLMAWSHFLQVCTGVEMQPPKVGTLHTYVVLCLLCLQELSATRAEGRDASSRSVYDNDDEAAVSGLKPEMWIKSAGSSASTRSMERPGKGDVCSIS